MIVWAFDNDDDSLVFRWIVNDEAVGTAPEFTYITQDTGWISLSCIVMDGTSAGAVTWAIYSSPTDYVINDTNPYPSRYYLSNAYPNPFNSQTFISFEIPHRTEVKLTLYDITGRRIAILFDGTSDAGLHRIAIRSDQIASGFYILNMKTTTFSKSIQVVKIS